MAKRFLFLLLVVSSAFIMSANSLQLSDRLSATFNTPVAQVTEVAPEPVAEEKPLVPRSLRSLKSSELQKQLKDRLRQNPTWRRLIDQKRLSVGIVDMADQQDVRYAAVNGRHMMYAASLPKIAVLAAAHDRYRAG